MKNKRLNPLRWAVVALVLLAHCTLLTGNAAAQKTVYIPDSWSYNATTEEYTEGGNSDLQWSYNRSKQTDNCIIFWQKGFGADPSKAPSLDGVSMTFDVDAVLQVAENCYALNVDKLGFSCSNMLNKYKIIILMNYTTTWTCYGGGYDFECSALWLNPATVKPAGHSLAHEVGHSFHYMAYAAASNYSHYSSQTDNTGFHLSCGNGQAIWEQTAQWQAAQAYPELMYSQSIGIFRNSHNYAFSHEWHRYQSYWFHYYLCQHYDDITTVAQVWKQPMTGQTNGKATDFNQALMALKGLSDRQLYQLYFDYACRLVTWDLDACVPYRSPYIGDFNYRCVLTDDGEYQVALASCPQGTGFNVIPLQVPQAGTEVTTHLTGVTVGAALLDSDPGEYLDGNSQFTAVTTRRYNSNSSRSSRGFRMGYVALMQDGTRRYFSEDSVYCQGSRNTTEDYSFTLPEGVSRLWLVVSPALKTYQSHRWDEKLDADDMWPYKFSLEGTDIGGTATVYATPTLDGRDMADITFTYDVSIPRDAANYTGVQLPLSGRPAAMLGTAFQLQLTELSSKMMSWTTQGPANGRIVFYAVNPDGQLAQSGSTANGYGHWFDQSGTVSSYAQGYLYSEFVASSTPYFYVGQYPGKCAEGSTYTIRQALKFRKTAARQATAYFVFRVTVGGSAATASLAAIDYDDPTTGIETLRDGENETLRNGENEILRNGENEEMRNAVYDLAGRRLSHSLNFSTSHSLNFSTSHSPRKGLYIQNGRKVVK